jgi:hypothetical protein
MRLKLKVSITLSPKFISINLLIKLTIGLFRTLRMQFSTVKKNLIFTILPNSIKFTFTIIFTNLHSTLLLLESITGFEEIIDVSRKIIKSKKMNSKTVYLKSNIH